MTDLHAQALALREAVNNIALAYDQWSDAGGAAARALGRQLRRDLAEARELTGMLETAVERQEWVAVAT